MGDENQGGGPPGLASSTGGVGTPNNDFELSRKKRRAEGSPIVNELMVDEVRTEIVEAVQKVRGAISSLSKLVNQSSKTRRDIKEETEIVQNMSISLLQGIVLKHLSAMPTDQVEAGKKEEEPRDGFRKKYFCEKCSKEMKEEEEQREIITDQLSEALDLNKEEFLEFIGKPWPESVYVKTKEVVANPLNEKGELVIFIKDKKEKSRLIDMVKSRYPDIEEVMCDESEEDKLQFIESTVKTRKGVNTKRVHIVEIQEEKDIREVLTRLRDENLTKECTKVVVATSAMETREVVRKSLEVIFTGKKEEINLCVPGRESFNMRDMSVDRQRRERNTEAVVIKTNVSTYAETLRNIRAVVNPEDFGVEVKAVRRNKDDNVVIVTNVGKAQVLQREIAAKIQGVEARVTGNNVPVLIFDIDASIKGNEIEEYIRRTTKEHDTVVRSLRLARAGTQIATVTMPAKAAETLIQEGDIKIGWTRCRVKPKIDIVRCYNCLHMGHHSDICREEKKERRCLHCAEPGHTAKECTGRAFCTGCNHSGHRNDSVSCPRFKKMLQISRSEVEREKELSDEKEKITEDKETEEMNGEENMETS